MSKLKSVQELKKVNLYKIKADNLEDENPFGYFLKEFLSSNYDHVQCLDGTYEGYIRCSLNQVSAKTEDQIPWLVFLNNSPNGKKYEYSAHNKFPKAILALKIKIDGKDQFYVVAFGQHGDSFLDKDYIVHDFGIKIGMNICDVDQLRRVQTTRHEAISQQTERQASIGTNLSVFNIDNEAEFLKTLSGYVKDDFREIIDSFKGKENIVLNFKKNNPLTWENLIAICKKLEERYCSDDYKNTDFKVYDNFRYETDSGIIKILDEKLCRRIEVKDFSKIHLAPPKFITEDEAAFTYKKKDENSEIETYLDLFIEDLVGQKGRKLKNLTKGTLRSWKIYQYNYEDRIINQWNAYQCLVAEVDLDKKIYILSNGYWREVSDQLKNRVDSYIQNHGLTEIDFLPDDVSIFSNKKKQNREEVYNSEAAKKSEKLFLFDKSKISIANERRYEVCDLFSSEKHFIHVKRFSSGTASVSHIFTQGRFYADAFSTDENCRESMKNWINTNILPENDPKERSNFINIIPDKNNEVKEAEYTVIFCILHDGSISDLSSLPFMAQYEFMNAHRYLTEIRKFECKIVFKKVQIGQKKEMPKFSEADIEDEMLEQPQAQ